MKMGSVSFFFIVAVILLTSCNQVTCPDGGQLAVSWKVISNAYTDHPAVKACFTIKNNSNFTLNATNWALYYSQSPRGITGTEGLAEVTHLSGDWFRLSPKAGFLLKPGEKTEITYEANAWWIKETDAPLGPYFVFYDKKGKEVRITTASDYAIEPFLQAEQINRYKNDEEVIPTPEGRYRQNMALTDIAPEKLPFLIPTPVRVMVTGKKIFFETAPEVLYERGLEFEAGYVAALVSKLAGSTVSPREAANPQKNSIFLAIKPLYIKGISKEAYKLEIKEDHSIQVTGSDAAGVFHGIQSLMAMIPAGLFAGVGQAAAEMSVLTLEDAPRFPYRGLHMDVSRNFQQKETVKKMVDLMAFYKLNYLMLYLSEDEGWRIDIEELPELVQVGSRRGHTAMDGLDRLHPSYGSGAFADSAGSYGSGYYTREDFKEILKYADQRHVHIIPTINLPGHSRAAIKAMEARYAKFMEQGNQEKANEFRLIDPEDTSKYNSAQSYNDNIVCVARESVYKFYETVIDDIMQMYQEAGVPLEFFHTGGDEVPEGSWSGSPLCKKLMETLPDIRDPKNLQSYFLRRTVDILAEKNLKIGGWEEVALLKNDEGKYIPNPEFPGKNVYPWAWNNQGQWANLAYRLANAGYPVVMCDVSNFYLDLAYDKDPKEPGLYWGGFCDARSTWQFAPFNSFVTNLKTGMGKILDPQVAFKGLERLHPDAEKNIMGLQAQLWGETVKGPNMLEYYALPKLIGFSETAWAQPRIWEKENDPALRKKQMDEGWNIFANALGKRELPRLSQFFGGFNYRIPLPGAMIENGILNANIEYPGLEIRFTTDGTEPTRQSTRYTAPVPVSGEVKLKAFDAAGKSSRTVVTGKH